MVTPPVSRANHTRSARRARATGQTLVEFALSLMVFMLVTVGLIDGLRVIFYYSQIQEAAREGARWGAVEVGRAVADTGTTPWGTFNDPGNKSGTYCDTGSGCTSLTGNLTLAPNHTTATIVGAATVAMTAVNLNQARITITAGIAGTTSDGSTPLTESLHVDSNFTNKSVTVKVEYPFKPILGMVFGGATINLMGVSTMLHE